MVVGCRTPDVVASGFGTEWVVTSKEATAAARGRNFGTGESNLVLASHIWYWRVKFGTGESNLVLGRNSFGTEEKVPSEGEGEGRDFSKGENGFPAAGK